MKVERICTPKIATIERNRSVREAAQAMAREHVGALLVRERTVQGLQVAGIVTDRDLVLLALAEPMDPDAVAVEKVMSPVVVSIAIDADLLEAVAVMRDAGVRRLMVTDAQGAPCGLLSFDDVIDGLAAELADAAALMRAEARREAGGFSPAPLRAAG